MKRENDLGNDSILGLVFKLAIPAMVAQLVNVLYSIVDRMYIGNIPVIGDIALAGVGVCAPIVTLLTSFGTLVGIGGSIMVAMKLGEKKVLEAQKILANSFLLLVIFSTSLTIIFMFIKEKLLLWFGASLITFQYADTYLTIYTLGTFFALLALGLNYFITCQGFATAGMFTVVIGAITNIILDFVFICIYNLGVAGAAYATVIAQMVSCTFVMVFLLSKKSPIKITLKGYSMEIIKRIISIGFSPFIIMASDSVLIIILNTVLHIYGSAEQGDLLISAATIVQSYMMLITGPLIGITSGTQAIISYNYGAKQTQRVRQAERKIVTCSIVFCTIMFTISRIMPEYFVGIFTNNPQHMELSVWGIKAFTLGIIPMSIQYSLVDGITALGKTKISLFLSLFRKITYSVLLIVLPMFFTAKSAFYAQPIADTVGSIMCITIFSLLFNRFLTLREQEVDYVTM